MSVTADHVIRAEPPRYLLAMPLHAITEVYGEAGLRGRFALEVEGFPVDARNLACDALAWAGELHAGQRRSREPQVNHVLRVAIRMSCYYGVTDAEVIAAALLHDSVEDAPWAMAGTADTCGPPPRERALAALRGRFGSRVARLVAAVTTPPRSPDRDRVAHYCEHLRAALTPEPWARVVKFSDFTDNGVGIIHSLGPRIYRRAVKYQAAVPVLRALLHLPDTPLGSDVQRYIDGKLSLAQTRISAVLSSELPNLDRG